jgi:hypothetical protein
MARRKRIVLEGPAAEAVERLARAAGISPAELVRRALRREDDAQRQGDEGSGKVSPTRTAAASSREELFRRALDRQALAHQHALDEQRHALDEHRHALDEHRLAYLEKIYKKRTGTGESATEDYTRLIENEILSEHMAGMELPIPPGLRGEAFVSGDGDVVISFPEAAGFLGQSKRFRREGEEGPDSDASSESEA